MIVLMAVDHANIFITRQHGGPELWTGVYPLYRSAMWFLTRFLSHFAAPGFFFLMGLGITLFSKSRKRAGWDDRLIDLHFIKRGLLLIGLQFMLEDPVWQIVAIAHGQWTIFPDLFRSSLWSRGLHAGGRFYASAPFSWIGCSSGRLASFSRHCRSSGSDRAFESDYRIVSSAGSERQTSRLLSGLSLARCHQLRNSFWAVDGLRPRAGEKESRPISGRHAGGVCSGPFRQ